MDYTTPTFILLLLLLLFLFIFLFLSLFLFLFLLLLFLFLFSSLFLLSFLCLSRPCRITIMRGAHYALCIILRASLGHK